MKGLRYLGLVVSSTVVLIALIFAVRCLMFRDIGFWIISAIFFALGISSMISLIFLRWVKPIDQLNQGLAPSWTINKAVLDEKLEDSEEFIDKVLGLKDFAPIKFWVIISIIANLFIGGFFTYFELENFESDKFRFNIFDLISIAFWGCLYASSIINIIIYAKIYLYKKQDQDALGVNE